MKPFDDIRMNYLRGKGSYSRPGQLAKKKKKEENMKEEHGAGDFGTDELTNRYKKETPGQQTEAKATYCGRCGTTHVKPSEGGTCPALKKEEVDSTTSAARKPVKVKVNGKEVVRMQPVKNNVQTEALKVRGEAQARSILSDFVDDYIERTTMPNLMKLAQVIGKKMTKQGSGFVIEAVLNEKTLTPAELKKREEIAKAIERDKPDMPMDKKMAIATAAAKRVAEMKNFHELRTDLEEGSQERLDMIRKAAAKVDKQRKAAAAKAAKDAARHAKRDNEYQAEEMDKPPFTPDPKKKPTKNSDGTPTKPMSRAKQLANRGIKVNEAVSVNLRGGKVPVGQHKFVYKVDKTPKYIENSIKERDKNAKVEVKGKEVHVTASAGAHSSFIDSLRKFRANGTVSEAVGTSAKYANKTGFMGGKYQSHDHMMTMKNFSSIRDKRHKQRDDEHKKQDPKMQKMGYAKHMVDTQKAKKKAQARGADPSKTARSDYHNKNGITPNRKLPESKLQTIRDTLALSEGANDVRQIGKDLMAYAKKSGGIDRKHFETMANDMIRTGKLPSKKHMQDMDTDPRELVYGLIFNVMGEKGLKPYGVKM